MAGSLVSVRVGVEGVADATRITCAKSFGDTAVGSDLTFWDLADESIDLFEEIHICSKTLLPFLLKTEIIWPAPNFSCTQSGAPCGVRLT